MIGGSSIFTSWFHLVCGSHRSQLEFVLWWCDEAFLSSLLMLLGGIRADLITLTTLALSSWARSLSSRPPLQHLTINLTLNKLKSLPRRPKTFPGEC